MSLTVGVDLASQDKKTALCVIDWDAGRVVRLQVGVSDEEIVDATTAPGVEKLAIDAPLGWPEPFVRALASYHDGGPFPVAAGEREQRKGFYLRETDRVVERAVAKRPLSVSTDKIAYIALRAAGILQTLGSRHRLDVRRDGSGRVAEVYPGAALVRWRDALGSASAGYKVAGDNAVRDELVAAVRARTQLDLPAEQLALCRASDDAFDALLSAVIGRAVARGRCDPIPPEHRDLALREGWIHLPGADALGRLADAGSAD